MRLFVTRRCNICAVHTGQALAWEGQQTGATNNYGDCSTALLAPSIAWYKVESHTGLPRYAAVWYNMTRYSMVQHDTVQYGTT